MEPTVAIVLACLLLPLSSTLAQGQSTSALSTTSSPTSSTSFITATASSTSDPNPSDYGVENYYYVFIAIILFAAGLAAFFFYRRKKAMRGLIRRGRLQSSFTRNEDSWDPARARRRNWHGRARSDDIDLEEGLNENGEAPPPYIPKSNDGENNGDQAANSPAMPLHTLSREEAGLKPPDYSMVTEDQPSPLHGGSSTCQQTEAQNRS